MCDFKEGKVTLVTKISQDCLVIGGAVGVGENDYGRAQSSFTFIVSSQYKYAKPKPSCTF